MGPWNQGFLEPLGRKRGPVELAHSTKPRGAFPATPAKKATRQEFTPGPVLGSQQGAPQLAQPQDMAGDARNLAHLSLGTSTGPSLCSGWFCMCKVRPARNVSVIQPSLSWSGQLASPSCSVLPLPRLVQPAGLLKQHCQGQAGGTEQCLPLLHLLAHQHPQCAQC